MKILASRRKELNKVDKKRSNENEDGTYFKMIKNQNSTDDIIETQRTIIVPQKDGTEKKTVIRYQLALLSSVNLGWSYFPPSFFAIRAWKSIFDNLKS